MAKDYKLDLFGLLGKLDRKDYQAYEKYSDEERKEISPLVLMRWLSGTSDRRQIVYLNELPNKVVFWLPEHKGLMLKLLAATTSGQPKKYQWLSMKSNAGEKRKGKKSQDVIEKFYGCSPREANEYLQMHSKDEIIEMCERLGLQKEEIQQIKKEL